MLTFLRINDPFRLLFVGLFLFAIRGAFWWWGLPITVPEVGHLVIGEKLSQGAFMYAGVWDSTPPVAAGTYWLLVALFGKSVFPFQLTGVLLIVFQASLWNLILLRYTLYNEKNYVPALLYAVFMCASFDLAALSPTLLATTFLLLAADRLFSLRDRPSDSNFFLLGVYTGLASLSDLATISFLFFIIFGAANMRTIGLRQFFLILYGFGFVVSLFAGYYFWFGHFDDFVQNCLFTLIRLAPTRLLDVSVFGVLIGPSFLVLVIAIIRTFTERGFINFQVSCQTLMLFWSACALMALPLSHSLSTQNLVLFAPPFSFFATHFFLGLKKKPVAELFFILYLTLTIGVSFASLYLPQSSKHLDFTQLNAKIAHPELLGKKVLVLGNNNRYYFQNTLATPYYDWQLAQHHFSHLDYYTVVVDIYLNFGQDPPHVIVDEANFAKHLFRQIPLLGQQYEADPRHANWYRQKGVGK